MDCSTPGFPVHHQLPELAQIHVHRVSDAIQPSHPLSPPSFPTFNFPQHQGLFQWASSSHEVAKVLELQHQSFQWFPLGLTGLISLLSKGCSRVFSTQFKRINSLALSLLYSPALTSIHDYWKNHTLTRWTSVGKVMSLLFHMLSRFVIAFLPRSKHLSCRFIFFPF